MSTFALSADDLLGFKSDSSLSFFDWVIKARAGLRKRANLRAPARRRAHLPDHDLARKLLCSKSRRVAAMRSDG